MYYHKELDSLRGIASFIVVAFHSGISSVSGGFFAVDIFFVISGYLIATNIISNKPTFSTFIFKRASRLFPLIALVTLTSIVVQYIALGYNPTLQQFFVPLFAGNLFQQFGISTGLLSHTWSLGIEMQFYIAIFFILKISPPQYRLVIFLFIYFGIFLFRNEVAAIFPTVKTFEIFYNNPVTRFTGFTAGVLIAITNINHVRAPLLFLAIVALTFCITHARFYKLDEFIAYIPIIEMSAFTIILALVTKSSTWLHKLLSIQMLVYTGQLSYGIYLWHYPIIRLFRADLTVYTTGINPYTTFIVTSVVSVILAHLSFQYFERAAIKKMKTFLLCLKSDTAN
jgi:peptidoglycan/LPS O-acetylase OafA/YrhL